MAYVHLPESKDTPIIVLLKISPQYLTAAALELALSQYMRYCPMLEKEKCSVHKEFARITAPDYQKY